MHQLSVDDLLDQPHRVGPDDRALWNHRTLDAEAEAARCEARERFGEFILTRLNPGSHFRDRERLPVDHTLFAEAGDLGLLQFALPTEVGGAGRDKFTWGVVIAELARMARDPGFPVLLDITVENTELILSSGRRELIEGYVADLVSGRRYAVQAAYESRDPHDYETTARFQDGAWVLNGVKRFVAGAVFADVFIVYLRDEASDDILAFLVERDDPGVAPVRLETTGLRSMGFGQIILQNVRLPESRLVWRSDALSELNGYARGRRMMTACGVLGAIERITESCVESLSTRIRGGRRVLDYPNVERSVGELRVLVETARSLIYRALDSTRAPDRDPYFDELATTAKHQVSECALRIGHLVMNLQGGESYMTTFPWEKFVRDILGLIGGQGAQELLLIQLGQRSILGFEGRQLREQSVQRRFAKLADAWWAVSALDAKANSGASEPSYWTAAALDVVATAGLEIDLDRDVLREVAELLDRSHMLFGATESGGAPDVVPPAPSRNGAATSLAADAWAFAISAIAVRTGLLAQFIRPRSPQYAAAKTGMPREFVQGVVDVLATERFVHRQPDGTYLVDPGLESVLVGGPTSSAFNARLTRTIIASSRLRAADAGAGALVARNLLPGFGDEAGVLADVLVNALLGRLVGLGELLNTSGVRAACLAGDAGRSAAALAGELPSTSVLSLEPAEIHTDAARSTGTVGRSPIEVRVGGVTDVAMTDQLALIWFPTAGHSITELTHAVATAAEVLLPGGWIVLPCASRSQRTLGAATARLELTLLCGATPPDIEVEQVLRRAGFSQVDTAWDDEALGLRLVVGCRPR